jgi:hypothetical protein
MMKEAVALDPKDGKAWAQLGMWQTRAGLEQDGVKSLEEWWKHDHFNVRAFNTLEKLYTQWIPARTSRGPKGTSTSATPRTSARSSSATSRGCSARRGDDEGHYMFAPSVPVHVEMYSSREHFSVRTSGLPNIGIQGVCFGHVVAAMSPASEPFNWGNVLWHELGHVFAIQLSKNHVPRWFTEGLSEYETIVRRPEWQRELDPELYSALKKNALPGAVDMNRAFTHADRRPRRHRGLLRREPDDRLHGRAVRLRRRSRARSSSGERASARRRCSREAFGVDAAGVRRALPGVGDGAPVAVPGAVHVRR